MLTELRDRLRAGDVWVAGSRRYRSFEERLISTEALRELREAGTLQIAVEPNFEQFITARRALLDERLQVVAAQAAAGALPDVTITNGVLRVAPIGKATPPAAETLAGWLYTMLPRIRITDLLVQVARWTKFLDCFTHLRTGEVAGDSRVPDGRATSAAFPWIDFLSCGLADLIGPGVNDGITVNVVEIGQDAAFEFVL